MSKSQEYLAHLFSDKLVFEKEVLNVNCDEDRKEIMGLICSDMCEDEAMASKISFLKIKSIDQLDFSGVAISIVQSLLAELLSVLKEKRYTRVEMENVKKNKEYVTFLYELAQIYMRRFGTLFYKKVVDTFFDLISIADKADNLSPVVLEAINGTKKHKSFFEQHGGGQILYKPDHAWMRVKQAKDDKNNQAKKYQYEIVRLVRRVDELKLHISAIVAAKALTMVDVQRVTPKLLLDMFTEEDDIQLHTKKTMFSYVPAGEKARALSMIAKQASTQVSKSEEQEDYKKIAAFFQKCQNHNTPDFLERKFEEFKKELDIKSKRYREQRLKLKTLRDRPLDSFDLTLKKVKEAMVYNLQHMQK